MSTPRAVELPGTTYATIFPASFGSLCQGMAHSIDGPMVPATVVASVSLTLDVVAQVHLCPGCAATLPAKAGGAA